MTWMLLSQVRVRVQPRVTNAGLDSRLPSELPSFLLTKIQQSAKNIPQRFSPCRHDIIMVQISCSTTSQILSTRSEDCDMATYPPGGTRYKMGTLWL